jgi:hypothetical protein
MSTAETTAASPAPVRDKHTDELLACLHWALQFCTTKGGGCVLHHGPNGEMETEHFVVWFARACEAYGVKYDMDLVWYFRASKTDRKRMEKDNPELVAKLAAAR